MMAIRESEKPDIISAPSSIIDLAEDNDKFLASNPFVLPRDLHECATGNL
jgi:hypothetical protein